MVQCSSEEKQGIFFMEDMPSETGIVMQSLKK